MTTTVPPRRLDTAAALVVAGVAFALYALVRPYADEATPGWVASGTWVVAHLLAVAALILLPIGLHAAGVGRAGLVSAVGSGLVLPTTGPRRSACRRWRRPRPVPAAACHR